MDTDMNRKREKQTSLRTMLAAAACKLTRGILHLTGRGGTALPGKVAKAIDPRILSRVSRGMQVMLVTGTNGKTTTCRMLENAVEKGGGKCLLNRSGANLLSGITAEFVCNTDGMGRPKAEYAVIECDEGALKQVAPVLRPKVIVVTNLFRDQLDRYGEVMNTLNKIKDGIRLSPDSILCLNADCSLTESLADDVPNRVVRYGISTPVKDQDRHEISDAKYCIHCGTEYRYRYHTYAHLGGFYCPGCGFRRRDPFVAVTDVLAAASHGSKIRLRVGEKVFETKVGLPAVYNIYNAAAAIAAGEAFGLPDSAVLGAVSGAGASFGRMEDFMLGDVRLQMILVKNPTGCNQAIDYILQVGEDYNVVICLNDRTADGHDISWIWDADYERLAADPGRHRIYVSGCRAEDMCLRLKYAGIEEARIIKEKDYGRLVRRLKKSRLPVYILPNYTSMLDFRRVLLKAAGGEAFWKG